MINDTLTKYGDSGFVREFESIATRLSRLNIRPPRKIQITGDWSWAEHPVSVRVFEDGMLTYCNHANYTHAIECVPISDDESAKMPIFVCRQCEAWSDDAEHWNN